MSMTKQTKTIPTIRADVQTLQVTTETLVENSGPKLEDVMALVKSSLEKEMTAIYDRLESLEGMGELYTDFTEAGEEGGGEETKVGTRTPGGPILPPKHVSY
jgi:ElaB/YqjD/DUF883 family membrane-anchored ribosome-binding protein